MEPSPSEKHAQQPKPQAPSPHQTDTKSPDVLSPLPTRTPSNRQAPLTLPPLPYNLRHHKLTISWVFAVIIIDSCFLPIILYYSLTFSSSVRVGIIFAIITSTTGIVTPLKYFLGLYSYISDARYRPATRPWWHLDFAHGTIAIAWLILLILLVVGSAPYDPYVPVLCLPPSAFVLYIGFVMLVLQLMHHLRMRLPYPVSSLERGVTAPPGVYFFVEDIVAVEGHGRREWRDALRKRYDASREFRKLLSFVSWVWIAGCFGNALIVGLITGLQSVNVAYGVGWAVPFIFTSVWAVLTIVIARAGLKREERVWARQGEAGKV